MAQHPSVSRAARPYPIERVQGYTDAVFAIAATLLVLDLSTSAFPSISTSDELWLALGAEWPAFIAFVVSFLLLSLRWMINVQQFRDLARLDATMVWLNNGVLLFVVLIPFTTTLNSQYGDELAGRVLLPLNFFLASLMSLFAYAWAASRDGHLLKDEALAGRRDEVVGGVAAVISGAVSVVLAPWIGSWAFLAYALNPLLQWPLMRRRRRRAAAAAPPSRPEGRG